MYICNSNLLKIHTVCEANQLGFVGNVLHSALFSWCIVFVPLSTLEHTCIKISSVLLRISLKNVGM